MNKERQYQQNRLWDFQEHDGNCLPLNIAHGPLGRSFWFHHHSDFHEVASIEYVSSKVKESKDFMQDCTP